VTPNQAKQFGFDLNQDGVYRDGFALLALPNGDFEKLISAIPDLSDCPAWARDLLSTEGKYSVYLDRQREEFERIARDRNVVIPETLAFSSVPGLSNELQQKLDSIRPRSIYDAGLIEGMTPAALVLLTAVIRKHAA
jgi:tRNA uridine 5-carboxymethylaminomethyl modification enzyme